MESVTKAVSGGYSGLVSVLQQNTPLLVVFSVLYITMLKQESDMRQMILQLDHKVEQRFMKLENSMEMMNMRLTNIEADIAEIKSTLKDHETRLDKLEK